MPTDLIDVPCLGCLAEAGEPCRWNCLADGDRERDPEPYDSDYRPKCNTFRCYCDTY